VIRHSLEWQDRASSMTTICLARVGGDAVSGPHIYWETWVIWRGDRGAVQRVRNGVGNLCTLSSVGTKSD
jgi:hypothetical protein